MGIAEITAPIKGEMTKFEPYFRAQLKTKIPLLDIITNYVLRRKGKQMRPMLVFLSAKLNGEISDSTYVAATLIELLHTATLIHDDVVITSYSIHYTKLYDKLRISSLLAICLIHFLGMLFKP